MYVSTLFIEGDDSQLKTEKLAAIKLTSTQGYRLKNDSKDLDI